MQEAGWSKARVRAALRSARKEDLRFDRGEVLGSMCTAPDPLAAEAFGDFLETNLGDPAHFPGTARLEKEVLGDLVQTLGGGARAEGRLLSGGTEANLLACYVAREATGRSRIVVPDSAHFSFEKAARMLRMELVTVPTRDHRADPEATAAAIDGDTALVVAIAGTTELGLVDPVPAMARVCRDRKVRLHVDAAFGGYLLPFMPGAPRFDLRVPGVTSVATDPHKVGLAPIPAGALVLRDGRDWERTAVPSPYVSTPSQSILVGTRPGAAAAAAWAAHRHLGRRGYARNAATCLQNARRLADGLRRLGFTLVAEPELTVVTFQAKDPRRLAERMRARGFGLNVVPRFQAIRIVVNPHVTRAVVDRFLGALAKEAR